MTNLRGTQLPTLRMIGFAWPPVAVGVAGEAVSPVDHAAREGTVARVDTRRSRSRFLRFGDDATALTERARSIEVPFATTTGLLSRLQGDQRYRNVARDRFARR